MSKGIDQDTTKKILNQAKLSQGDKQVKKKTEDYKQKGIRLQNFKEEIQTRLSNIESLERELSTQLENFEAIKEEIDNYEDSDEFEDDKSDGVVGFEQYRRVKRALNVLLLALAKLTLGRQIYHETTFDLKELIDEQKQTENERKIMEEVSNYTEKIVDHFEKSVDKHNDKTFELMKILASEKTGISENELEDKVKQAVESSIEDEIPNELKD